MKTADRQTRLIQGYIELMKNLSLSSKLDLITRLTESIKSDIKEKNPTFEKAFGAWDKAESAEEITDSIRFSRQFTRQTEEL